MTATAASILSQIKSLELQIKALKAQAQMLAEQEGQKIYTFADLYGCFPEFGQLSEEEIDEVLYREPPDFESIFEEAN